MFATFNKTTLVGAAFLTFALVPAAKADHMANATFPAIAEALSKNPQSVETTSVFDKASGASRLSATDLSKLNAIAYDQAQIWGDTILEGDYEADGKTEIDHVDALTANGQVVAYRLFYSERGWDTSECTFTSAHDADALKLCQEGRIQEASFVSPDFSSWTRDPNAFATFTAAQ